MFPFSMPILFPFSMPITSGEQFLKLGLEVRVGGEQLGILLAEGDHVVFE